jgi:hypothetical protein
MFRGFALFVCAAIAFATTDRVRAPLTNEDIVKLVRAGFDQAIVLQAIDINPPGFDLSPHALASLRKAGVSDAVIAAMSGVRSATEHVRLLEPGVYVKRGATYVLVQTEPVAWRVSTDKSYDLTRLTLAGRVQNRHSLLPLTGPAELLIVPPPGTFASEYRILRADEKNGWREFRAEAALKHGVMLGVSGKPPVSAAVDETFDLGVRVLLGSLPKGDYGVLPPGLFSSGRLVEEGTIHTFSVE